MIEVFTWTLAALSVVGVVLNVKKKSICFVIWAITNAAWAVYDFSIGAYAQSALFAVYFGLAIWGLLKWKKEGL